MAYLKDMIIADINKGSATNKKKANSNPHKASYNSSETNVNTLVITQTLNGLFREKDPLREVRAGLHASAVIVPESQFCYREQVLSLLYKQSQGKHLATKLLKIFAAGNSIHEKWQTMFKNAGIAQAIEARSYDEKFELYFTPDAEVVIGGKLYVCEIKSMNTYAFQKATSHPSGEKQCMLYMFLKGIPNGFVLAEDKNNQEIKIFPVEYDFEKVMPYVHRLEHIQKYKREFLKTKVMVPGLCSNSTCPRARDCNLRDSCFNIGMGRKKL